MPLGGLISGITDSLGIGGGGSAPQIQYNPWDVNSGLGSANFGDGSLNLNLSPELSGMAGNLFSQAGNLFNQSQNPQETMGFLQQMFQPQFERQQLSQESRLLNQGLLGSTTGALQTGALREGQNQALMQATLGAQNQMFNQAQGLLGQFLNLQQQPLQLAGLGAQLGGAQMDADSFNAQARQKADATRAGFFNNLLTAGIGAAFPPAGIAMAAAGGAGG